MKWIIKLLHQSYPLPKSGKASILPALLFGIFIAGFLIFFEPFNLNHSNLEYNNWKIIFFGVITMSVYFIFHNGLQLLLPKEFAEENWKIKHQIFFYILMLFCIATFNGIYINYLYELLFKWTNYGLIIIQTLVLGAIPIIIYILFNYNKRLKQHLKAAQQMTQYMERQALSKEKRVFEVFTSLKNDTFQFDEQIFLFAQSDGNYTHIHCLAGEKSTHRLSLHSLTTQLNSPHLMRCHRSFLVNLKQVEQIQGNAQGLKLTLSNYPELIPVSRKYIPIIKSYFEHQ